MILQSKKTGGERGTTGAVKLIGNVANARTLGLVKVSKKMGTTKKKETMTKQGKMESGTRSKKEPSTMPKARKKEDKIRFNRNQVGRRG